VTIIAKLSGDTGTATSISDQARPPAAGGLGDPAAPGI